MPREVLLRFPVELPEELRDEEVLKRGREAIVMELLRRGEISQGKASELLGIDRHTLFDLMDRYNVPAIDMTEEELEAELSGDIFSEGDE